MEVNGNKQNVQLSGIKDRMCLSVAKLFLPNGPLRQFGFRKSEITRFDSMDNWISDRIEQIEEYRKLFEPFADFEGKTVLELGCNRGYLLDSFLKHHNFKAIGADIDDELLALGREELGDKIEFIRSTPTTIPLPDASVDVIYSIDTFEHLSHPNEILMECHRVLRPGGVFFLHFSAWYTPYGSHLEDIIPLPWANTVFSMDTLLNVAAHLYESPDYEGCVLLPRPGYGQATAESFSRQGEMGRIPEQDLDQKIAEDIEVAALRDRESGKHRLRRKGFQDRCISRRIVEAAGNGRAVHQGHIHRPEKAGMMNRFFRSPDLHPIQFDTSQK